MTCEDCGKNEATKKYKVRERKRYGSNSYIGYRIVHVCEECWNKLFGGLKK